MVILLTDSPWVVSAINHPSRAIAMLQFGYPFCIFRIDMNVVRYRLYSEPFFTGFFNNRGSHFRMQKESNNHIFNENHPF